MDQTLCWTTGALGSAVALSSDVKECRGVTEQPGEKELFYTKGHTALGTVCMQQLQGGVGVGGRCSAQPQAVWLSRLAEEGGAQTLCFTGYILREVRKVGDRCSRQ